MDSTNNFCTPKTLLFAFYECTGVSTDTRTLQAGDMFFALSGSNFNGNRFAAKALEAGAKYVVVDDEGLIAEAKKTGNTHYLAVKDTLQALQDTAHLYRKQLDIACIAITGSNGKTTTKELLGNVLATTYRTHITQGNLNNHIGVPITLLRMPRNTQMAVIEMGANHPNEINLLCSIAYPNFGLITNIGKAHLEGFGSIEGVQKGKGELFEFLEGAGGRAFVNANDKRISELAYYIQKATTYGSSKRCNIYTEITATQPYLKLTWHQKTPKHINKKKPAVPIPTQLSGIYNAENVTAAIAVGNHFRVPAEKIQEAIANYSPANKRSEIIKANKGKLTIIQDAYNANPSSMAAALANVSNMQGRKVVCLGDMLELGTDATHEHQQIVNQLSQVPQLCHVILIGPQFSITKSDLPNVQHFKDVAAAKAYITAQQLPLKTDIVLLKGSRSMQVDTLVDAFK